ncbi:MAG: hypothetical protein WAS27_00345 [Candidatus Saccharimonadales bacterium]
MTKQTERKAIDKVFILLGSAATVVLLAVGGLAWYGYTFATGMVTDQLSAQRIFFPAKDSESFAALSSEDQAAIEPFAGQQLTTGEQAKVYANNYIGAHLHHMADGKTYAEISQAAQKEPDDKKLAGLKAALFQGETLRGMLLGSGYAFWTFGMIALYAAIASFVGAIFMALLVLLGLRHLAKIK